MTLQIFSTYKLSTDIIEVKITSIINASFIQYFVNDYKLLLNEKQEIGNEFIQEIRILKLVIDRSEYEFDEDFDLLFISYLTLFKLDFPNIEIEFHFINFTDNTNSNSYLFKLAHHRTHLLINSKKQIFKIFKNSLEFNYNKISQSISYMPPLIIDENSIGKLFSKKDEKNNYKENILYQIRQLKSDKIILNQQKEPVFKRIRDLFIDNKGALENWEYNDLSTLYFIKTLSELNILRHVINCSNNLKSDYQIGKSIIYSKDDTLNEKKFRDGVLYILDSNNVFEFSDVETYIFSLVVQNSELFKIPSSLKKMYNKIEFLLDDPEKRRLLNYETSKNSERSLKSKFIDIYLNNLQRIIDYTKEVSYGLQELAKNAVEHTKENQNEGFGIISARIYSLNKLKDLKNISHEWLNNYEYKHKFMDINVIDSGLKSVIETYSKTLQNELYSINEIPDVKLREELKSAYKKDIKAVGNYLLNNLFNFDSLKLIHQINRTKSRLGLLIFSQTILFDKKAFISLASNNISETDNIGSFLFNRDNVIIDESNQNYLSVGTNFNFTIPINEDFEYFIVQEKYDENQSSSASSVFQELHNYGFNLEKHLFNFNELQPQRNYEKFDKYSKLDNLKAEIGILEKNQILLIDANKIIRILENSSDWVRFLASLQFTSIYIKDIIIINFDLGLYQEFINVLKIFNKIGNNSQGFWKKDKYILFFIPVKNDSGNIFWFNSLLYSAEYSEFIKINEDINLYHQNLSKLVNKSIDIRNINIDYNKINSLLFSSAKKLLNFELLLKNSNGVTLFEETLNSLINIEINNTINEN